MSVIVWHTFKQELFQLLDERLSDDWEIVGSPTNSIIPFEEYIILYFTRKTTHLRLAALKLLEFLASLKFYADKWRRAYYCALLCNLIRRKESTVYDYYLQNYFLFAYSRISTLREFYVETPEGYTFIQFDRLHDYLAQALEFLDQERYSREVGGLEMKTRVVGESDGFVEVDEVLFACLDLYMEVG